MEPKARKNVERLILADADEEREAALAVGLRDAQSLRLLRSHATSSGERRSTRRVRAMLTIRLNQLAADGNGIRPEVLDALAEMIAADALPPVREGGSVGTADLAALATTALVLAGEVRSTPPPRHGPPTSAPATR